MACRRAERRTCFVGSVGSLPHAATVALCWALCFGTPAGLAKASDPSPIGSASVRTILDASEGLIDLALAPNGQRLYGLSADGATVVSMDCGRDATGVARVVVRGDSPDGPGRRIGCIDSSVVAVLRAAPTPLITTHLIPVPPEPADAAEPLQLVATTDAEAANASVPLTACLTVSHTRNWLALTAFSGTTPLVLRAPVAGVRVGSFSTRHSPELEGIAGVSAASVSLADELILITSSVRGAGSRPETPPATDSLAMYATPGGWELLRLDTGLRDIRDACVTNGSGRLWVITGSVESVDPPQPAGLWRLDAALRNRRQAIAAVLVLALDEPRTLAAGNDEVLYALVDDGRRVIEIRPSSGKAAGSGTP